MFLTTLASGIILAAGGAVAGYALDRRGVNWLDSANLLPNESGISPSTVPGIAQGRPVPTEVPAVQGVYGRFAIPRLAKVPVAGGEISAIPGNRGLLALTVDDGVSAATIKGYCDFVERTGFRMTFFVTSNYDGWVDNKVQLRRLIESGHVQMANHTVSHPSLTKCSDHEVVRQLAGCERFLKNTFGVSARPYFRPPFGDIDDRVARIAANEGYSTPVLWYGSFADAGKTSPIQVRAMARRWLLPEHIVIGHANNTSVTHCFDYIESLMHTRKLQPVTLDDIYTRSA